MYHTSHALKKSFLSFLFYKKDIEKHTNDGRRERNGCTSMYKGFSPEINVQETKSKKCSIICTFV